MTENEIAKQIMDAAFDIHRNIGPGLLESVYEVILAKKLEEMGLAVQRQVSVPIRFEGFTWEHYLFLPRNRMKIKGKMINHSNNRP